MGKKSNTKIKKNKEKDEILKIALITGIINLIIAFLNLILKLLDFLGVDK